MWLYMAVVGEMVRLTLCKHGSLADVSVKVNVSFVSTVAWSG